MSSLTGNALKGEKGKGKFSALKINSIYATKGNEQEVHQQKNTLPRSKHGAGMQKLGTLPAARKPANLPSIKSEISSSSSVNNDNTAANIVPSSNARWATKQGDGQMENQSIGNATATQDITMNHMRAGITPQAQHAQLHPPMQGIPAMGQIGMRQFAPTDMRSWSMMGFGGGGGESSGMPPSFLAPCSPFFSHEFPSLSESTEKSSSTSGTSSSTKGKTTPVTATTVGNGQYGPGPSLRPQTEGSWTQGGSRLPTTAGMGGPGGSQTTTSPAQVPPLISYPPPGSDGVPNNFVPSGAGVALAGPYSMMATPSQYQCLIPPFLMKNSYQGQCFTNLQGPPPTGPHQYPPGSFSSDNQGMKLDGIERGDKMKDDRHAGHQQFSDVQNDKKEPGIDQPRIQIATRETALHLLQESRSVELLSYQQKSHMVLSDEQKSRSVPSPGLPTEIREIDQNAVLDIDKTGQKFAAKDTDEGADDAVRKQKTSAPKPVAKDASEFRELTQLPKPKDLNRGGGYSHHYSGNIPPRFQKQAAANVQNRQNPTSSVGYGYSQIADGRKNNTFSISQYSGTDKLGPAYPVTSVQVQRRDRKDSDIGGAETEGQFEESARGGQRTLSNSEYYENDRGKYDNQEKQPEYDKNREPDTRGHDEEYKKSVTEDKGYGASSYPEWKDKKAAQYDTAGDWEEEKWNPQPYVTEHPSSPKDRDGDYGRGSGYYEASHEKRAFAPRIEEEKDTVPRESAERWEKDNKSELIKKEAKGNQHDVGEYRDKDRRSSEESASAVGNKSHERDNKNYEIRRDRYSSREEKYAESDYYESGNRGSGGDYGKKERYDLYKTSGSYEHDREKTQSSSSASRNHRNSGSETHERARTESVHKELTFSYEDLKSPSSWAEESEILVHPVRTHEERVPDRRSYAHPPPRHIPGPITKEKLESTKYEETRANLTQLVRSTDKRNQQKKDEQTTEKKLSNVETSKEDTKKQEGKKIEDKGADTKASKEGNGKTTIGKESVSNQQSKDVKVEEKNQKAAERTEAIKSSPRGSDDSAFKEDGKRRSAGSGSSEQRSRTSSRRGESGRSRAPSGHVVYFRSGYRGARSNNSGYRPSSRYPSQRGQRQRDWNAYSGSDYSMDDPCAEYGSRDDRTSRHNKERPQTTKNQRQPSRKSDDRNRDYWRQQPSGGEYYSSVAKKYDSSRSQKESSTYSSETPHTSSTLKSGSVPIGGKKADSYGPPKTKSPFPSQDAEKKTREEQSSKNKESTNGENKASSTTSETSKSTSVSSARHSEDRITYGGGARTQRRTDGGDRISKGRYGEASGGYSQSSRRKSYGKEESERHGDDAWLTESEGSGIEEDEDRGGASGARRRGSTRRSSGQGGKQQRRSNARSMSGRRYDNKRAPHAKRDTQKFYFAKRSSNTEDTESAKPESDVGKHEGKQKVEDTTNYRTRRNGRDSDPKNRRPPSSRFSYGTRTVASSSRMQKDKETDRVEQQQVSTPAEESPQPKAAGPSRPAPPPSMNAWGKPISFGPTPSQKQETESKVVQEERCIAGTEALHKQSCATIEKAVLDGKSAPTETIVFENTNYQALSAGNKYASQLKNATYDKTLENEGPCSSMSAFGNHPVGQERSAVQMDLGFSKGEYGADMKLDFTFDTAEFSSEENDKTNRETLDFSRGIQVVQMKTAEELSCKIAATKKVWDDRGMVPGFEDSSAIPNFGSHSPYGKPNEPAESMCYNKAHVEATPSNVPSLSHTDVYSPVSQMQVPNSAYATSTSCQQTIKQPTDPNTGSSNVCKVKPQPQGSGSNGVIAATPLVASTIPSHPTTFSPPSFTYTASTTPHSGLSANGPNVAVNALAAATAQLNLQNAQYNNMGSIPSPPANIIFNSSQQIPGQAPTPTGLYHPSFQLDGNQVVNAPGSRTPFGGPFQNYGISSGLAQTPPFNQQNLFVPPPPLPSLTAAPSDVFPPPPSQCRFQPPPYVGSSQPINTPSTMLISTTTNSLMSPTIKQPPSNQQIGAIGAKSGYNPQAQQLFIPYEAAAAQMVNQNFLSGIPQRPASNLPPPPMQPPSSFYNAGAGTPAGQTGFFQAGNALQGPAAAYGLTFNAQTTAPPALPPNLQNFGSQLPQTFGPQYIKPCNAPKSPVDITNPKGILPAPPAELQMYFSGASGKPRIPGSGKAIMPPHPPLTPAQHPLQSGSFAYQLSNQMISHHAQHRSNAGSNLNSRPHYNVPIQKPTPYHQGGTSGRNVGGGGSGGGNRSGRSNIPPTVSSTSATSAASTSYYSSSIAYMGSASKLESSDKKPETSTESKMPATVSGSSATTVTSNEETKE